MKRILKSLGFKLTIAIASLCTCIGIAYAAWQIVTTNGSIKSPSNALVNNETVDVTIKYVAYTGLEFSYGEHKSYYSSTTISSLTDYNTMVSRVTAKAPSAVLETAANGSSTTYYSASSSPYVFTDSAEKVTVYLYVTSDIKLTRSGNACSGYSYTYSGTYYLEYSEDIYDYQSTTFSNNSYHVFTIASGSGLTRNQVVSELQLDEDGYHYLGLVYEEDGIASSTYYEYGSAINSDTNLYAVFNKAGTSYSDDSITTTINSASSGTLSFYADDGASLSVLDDSTYFEYTNSFALGLRDTSVAIGSSLSVNFALNDGSSSSTGSTARLGSLEPEDSAYQTCDYTVVLQNDLYVDGNLTIGGIYGSTTNTGAEGMINGEYVCLDLNGHNVYVSSTGGLYSYGLIKDTAGSGAIINKGGTVQTLAVAFDYKGGTSTTNSVNNDVFPFFLYSLPYLRCDLYMYYSGSTWGSFNAVCRVKATSYTSATNVNLPFIGDSSSCLFRVGTPVDSSSSFIKYEYDKLENVLADAEVASTSDFNTVYRNLIALKNRFTFSGVDFEFCSITINAGASVTTGELNFPISPFIDIYLEASEFTFSQGIIFMPGSTLYADEDSSIIMSANSEGSAAFYAMNCPYKYWKDGTFVDKDYGYSSPYGEALNNKYFWKYFDAAKIECYGTVYLTQSSYNTSSAPYLLSGIANISAFAYIDSSGNKSSSFSSHEEFFEEMKSTGTVYLKTYGYEKLGYFYSSSSTRGVFRGSASPLVSFGTAYIYDNSTYSIVGEYDSDNNLVYSGETTYFLDTSVSSFDPANSDLTPRECMVVAARARTIYYDGSYYVYFAGVYCNAGTTEIDSTTTSATIDISRVNGTSSLTVAYSSSLGIWQRS